MKAILVVDIPDDVNVDINNLIVKNITFKDISSDLGITHIIHKPKISIKPMPQKKKLGEDLFLTLTYYRFTGWNDCIDEILGEKE